MSALYIVEPGGQPTSHAEEEARALWSRGSISAQAYYWKEGMSDWRPATEFFDPVAVTIGVANPAPLAQPFNRAAGFAKDPTALTKFLKVMLWISAAVALLGLIISGISLATGNAAKTAGGGVSALDIAEGLTGLLQLLVFVVTGIPFLMWIHRANRNARALGAQDMQFTPGWSVGWYFIPIFNLWKPYQAMKEIWQASHNPHSWPTQEVASLVSHWWALWLLTGFLGQVAFRLSLRASTAQELTSAALLDLLSDLTQIGLCFVALRLVASIYQKQSEWAQRPA